MTVERGYFVSFEGGEGCGKSTLVKRLTADLQTKGVFCMATREPGGSDGAERIRELVVQGDAARWDAITEALLMYAARRDHVEKLIKPNLEKGISIISDRFADSSLAYQGFGHGNNLHAVRKIQDAAIGDFEPDLTFVIDVDPLIGLNRAKSRMQGDKTREDRFEQNDLEFHERVRKAFNDMCQVFRDRCVKIDGHQDLDTVYDEVKSVLLARFGWQL